MLWDLSLEYLRAVNRHFDPLSSLHDWPSQYRQPFHSDSACKELLKQLRFFAMRLRKKSTGMLIVKKPDLFSLSLPK